MCQSVCSQICCPGNFKRCQEALALSEFPHTLCPDVDMLRLPGLLSGTGGKEGKERRAKSMSHSQTEANTYHFGLRHHTLKRKEKEDVWICDDPRKASLTSFLISALTLLGTMVAESPEKHLPSPLTAHAEDSDSESSCWCVWSSLRTEGLYWFAWTKLPSRKDTA